MYELKIRDDIDLEELTKFGFKNIRYSNMNVYIKKIHGTSGDSMKIGTDRKIHYNVFSVHNTLDETIYDLIQAGLVVKEKKEINSDNSSSN